jgi:hypothetical protein
VGELSEVLASPLDDEVRRRFAEVCGDPDRARLIDLQLQLSAAEREQPRDREKLVALRDAASELLSVDGERWAGRIPLVARSYRFVRGFVEHIELSGERFLREGEVIRAWHPITSVRLTAPVDARALARSAALDGLMALDLSSCDLGDDGVVALAASPHLAELRWLSLYDNHLGLRGAVALARSSKLDRLAWLSFGKNQLDLATRPTPHGFVQSAAAAELEDRFGPRPWLHAAWEWPPTPYEVFAAG